MNFFVSAHYDASNAYVRNVGEEACTASQFSKTNMLACTNRNRTILHQSPFFTVWHREFMHLFEDALIMSSPNEKSLASHFWNWVLDHDLRGDSIIFTAKYYGACDPEELEASQASAVIDGPFIFENFPIRVDQREDHVGGALTRCPGCSTREAFPSKQEEANVVCYDVEHDISPWQSNTAGSFRDALEGFTPSLGHSFHNAIHGMVNGDMIDFTSPNDPIFFGHHSNIDRIFYGWQLKHPEKTYKPADDDETAPAAVRASAILEYLGNTAAAVWTPIEYEYDVEDLLAIEC